MAKKIIIFFLICGAVIISLLLVHPVSAQVLEGAPENEGGVDLGAPIGGTTTPTSFADYVNRIYNYAVVIGISLAILMIIFAGYKYMSSAGDPQSLAEAKEVLIGAIVGLVLILLTRLILATIDPRLLQFPQSAPELGGGGTTERDVDAGKYCQDQKTAYLKDHSKEDWQKGQCLILNFDGKGYAIAVSSDPTKKVDDNTPNKCGVKQKFYEFDWDCKLIRKVEEPSS